MASRRPLAAETRAARYFFDIHDGQSPMRDEEGHACNDASAIRSEAMRTLPEIAWDAIPQDGDNQAYTVLVRDESDTAVYTATLTFAGLWVNEVTPPAEASG